MSTDDTSYRDTFIRSEQLIVQCATEDEPSPLSWTQFDALPWTHESTQEAEGIRQESVVRGREIMQMLLESAHNHRHRLIVETIISDVLVLHETEF